MKLGIVTPWYGKDLQGGAERLAWSASTGLASRGHVVEVLTTCCPSFSSDWSRNVLRPGKTTESGVEVLRFPVDARDRERFERANRRLLSPAGALKPGVPPLPPDEAAPFINESIASEALLAHLDAAGAGYDAVLFLPYLYGPILNGWKRVAERAFLQPCLHDEPYAYLPEVAAMMLGVRGLLFNSEGEFEIARRLYGPGIVQKSLVVGSGIELAAETSGDGRALSGFVPERERYVLYIGRRAETKNVGLLIETFRGFKAAYPQSRMRLVLAGHGSANYSDRDAGIVDLGFVSDVAKGRLLRGCLLLVQPSTNESYSRSIMEAWTMGRPVVVHGDCAATARAVAASQGGWCASTLAEWVDAFAAAEALGTEALARKGELGRKYVEEFAAWPAVLERYETAFRTARATPPARTTALQVLDTLEYGEKTSLQVLQLRDAMRAAGADSRIAAIHLDARMQSEGDRLSSGGEGVPAIVHFAGSLRPVAALPQTASPRVLIVHEAGDCDAEELVALAHRFERTYALGLREYGLLSDRLVVSRLVPSADPARWNIAPDAALMNALQDGKTNILCVGEIRREKCQQQLLEVFANYLTLDMNARLVLAGRFDFGDPYYQELLKTVHGSALSQHVLITGVVSEPALAALYRTAHVYCSLSEHEGYAVALQEAMWFDMPVCAYRTLASADVLHDAGVLIVDKTDRLRVAALLKVLAHDVEIRSRLVESQRARCAAAQLAVREQARMIAESLGAQRVANLV
ncbi:MAG: glycosyltransferase family 4 protein [Candidatus Eremiobacteraeota bacterium]|nr:glycosyltransferase family 4 protein [Candidatus Eremiobacteraeota bacterium]